VDETLENSNAEVGQVIAGMKIGRFLTQDMAPKTMPGMASA